MRTTVRPAAAIIDQQLDWAFYTDATCDDHADDGPLLTAVVAATFHSAENRSKGRLWAGCLTLKNAA